MESVTLGQLLTEGNQKIKHIFGKFHLKHLRYFLITDSEKKIGLNYRNRLAHWSGISWDEVNIYLVGKLLLALSI